MNRFTRQPQLSDLLPTTPCDCDLLNTDDITVEVGPYVAPTCASGECTIRPLRLIEPRGIPTPCADCRYWRTMTLVLSAAVIALAAVAERWVR